VKVPRGCMAVELLLAADEAQPGLALAAMSFYLKS
jgi:hypothetical protein